MCSTACSPAARRCRWRKRRRKVRTSRAVIVPCVAHATAHSRERLCVQCRAARAVMMFEVLSRSWSSKVQIVRACHLCRRRTESPPPTRPAKEGDDLEKMRAVVRFRQVHELRIAGACNWTRGIGCVHAFTILQMITLGRQMYGTVQRFHGAESCQLCDMNQL